MSNLVGERAWTKKVKKILDDNLKELKKKDRTYENFEISCDSDNDKKTVEATTSFTKYLKLKNEGKEVDIKDFTDHKFHPDILVNEKISDTCSIPRLVIEVKYRNEKNTSATIHAILEYNQKAELHKRLYPGLRYGLLIGNYDVLPKHAIEFGNNFDFMLALPNKLGEKDVERLFNIVKKNLDDAEKLEVAIDENKNSECIGIVKDIITKEDMEK